MACFRGNREEFYGEVLLLDDSRLSLSADGGLKRSSRAGLLLRQVCVHLELEQTQFFGIGYSDKRKQTSWLDPEKTLSQHQDLVGPPFVFSFRVRFFSEEPHRLEPHTRSQFFLQLQRDVVKGNMPLPSHIRPRLQALRLQAQCGDYDERMWAESEHNQEVSTIYRALRGVSQSEAQTLFLSLCCSLPLYGVSLFTVQGQNQSEYFLGPTPGGVVIYRSRTLVGKYFWPRIMKLGHRKQTFELRIANRNGSETSFLFLSSSRSDCKRLWSCCVQHHAFYRMQKGVDLQGIKPATSLRALLLPRFSSTNHRAPRSEWTNDRTAHNDPSALSNQRACAPSGPAPCVVSGVSGASGPSGVHSDDEPKGSTEVRDGEVEQTAPPAVLRRGGGASSTPQSSAPWENGAHCGGMFQPRFPVSSTDPQRPHRRCRSLDGERPIGAQRRRARSHGNSSSESERSEQRQRRKHRSRSHGDHTPDSTHRRRHRNRSQSPDAAVWKHIQKKLLEPDESLSRETEEIVFTSVRVSQQPIPSRRSARGRRQRAWASASELQAELVPPLPITTATETSHGPTP